MDVWQSVGMAGQLPGCCVGYLLLMQMYSLGDIVECVVSSGVWDVGEWREGRW